MNSQDTSDIEGMRAQISANLEYLEGNGPFRVLTDYDDEQYRVIVLDNDSRVLNIDPQHRVHESVTEALQFLLQRTSVNVGIKHDREQDEARSRDSPSNERDRPSETLLPGTTPGGLFDPTPRAHFGFENNAIPQRPSHVICPGTVTLPSGGMFGTTPDGGLFGNNANVQGQPTMYGAAAGQGLFGNNTNVKGQPTGALFGNNANMQGQPTGALFGNNPNAQGWPNAVYQGQNLFGGNGNGNGPSKCPSGQGWFGCNGNGNEPRGGFDPSPHVPCLPVDYGLFAHLPGCNNTVSINLNDLNVFGTSPSGHGSSNSDSDGSNSVKRNRHHPGGSYTCRYGPQQSLFGNFQQGFNNQNNASNNGDQYQRMHTSPSSFSQGSTHANVADNSLSGPSARDRLQGNSVDSPTTPRTSRAPRGNLFGAPSNATNTPAHTPAKDKFSGSLFGQYPSTPSAPTIRPFGGRGRSLFDGFSPNVGGATDPKTPEPETSGPRTAARGESLFGSAPSKSEGTGLDGPPAFGGLRNKPSLFGSKDKSGLFEDYHARPTKTKLSKAALNHQRTRARHYKRALRVHNEMMEEGHEVPNSIFEMMTSALTEYARALDESKRIIREGGVVPDEMQIILEAGPFHPTTDIDVEDNPLGPSEDAPEISDSSPRRDETVASSSKTEEEPKAANPEKRARFAATVEDANPPSDDHSPEDSSITRDGKLKGKGKAVSRPSRSTETGNTKKKVSPKPTTQDSTPAAKQDAASSGGDLMGPASATPTKLADHIATITEADNGSSGTTPELSRVGAAMRAAAEQTASVPSVPRSMFSSQPATSGISGSGPATTQPSPVPGPSLGPAPQSLFAPSLGLAAPSPTVSDSAPRSMFAPSPGPLAPGPAPAPVGIQAPGFTFAPAAPDARGFSAPGPSAPGAPSFGGHPLQPTVVPVEEAVAESAETSVEESLAEPAAEVQEPATNSSAQTPAAHEPAAEQRKKTKTGGLFDSQWAS